MRKLISILVVLVALPLAARPALAEEHKVKESAVPKAALDAVKKKYPKAKLVGFEQENEEGKTLYEITLKNDGTTIDIDVSPEGKILAEESLIKKDALPAEVKKGLDDSKYGKWAIKRAERIITEEKEDAPTYEVVVADHGKIMEVVLDRSGKITKEEAKSAADND